METKRKLNIALISNDIEFYLPILESNKCTVFEFPLKEIQKAVYTVNVYANHQLFNMVLFEYFESINKYIRQIREENPYLPIFLLQSIGKDVAIISDNRLTIPRLKNMRELKIELDKIGLKS